MFATSQLLTFIVPLTLLTLTPGVDTFLVIRNSNRGGWRDGVASSLGICCGLFAHALIATAGISIFFLQSALAFSVLKLAGAGYLIWLGVAGMRSAIRPSQSCETGLFGREFRLYRSLFEGFMSNLLNPKTIVFYMAFLPQFIDPAGSVALQLLLLAALHFVIAMLYQSLLAVFVGRAGLWLSSRRVRRSLDALSGTVLLAFGLRLAFEKAP